MLLLVLFSILLDIVQNARDWNEKLNRVFKYMNQWLVQVFVCLFVCLACWLVGWLCVCFEAPRSLLPRPPTPSLLQYTFNSPWCLKRCCPLQRVYNCSNLLVQIVQNICLICLRNAGNLGCCFDQCLVYSLMSCDFPKPANSLHDIFMYLIETFRFAYSQHYRLHRKLHFTIFWLENIALLS